MAREKLPSTKWAGDRVGRVGGPDIMLVSSAPAEVHADPSDLGVSGLMGSPGWLVGVAWNGGDMTPSCVLLSHMLERVETCEVEAIARSTRRIREGERAYTYLISDEV